MGCKVPEVLRRYILPLRSVISMSPPGKKAIPQGESKPSATLSIWNFIPSEVKVSPGRGWVTLVTSNLPILPMFFKMKSAIPSISFFLRVAPKEGMPLSAQPLVMVAMSSGRVLPCFQRRSTKVCTDAPWQEEHSSLKIFSGLRFFASVLSD